MERKLRGNGEEIERKWRENEELKIKSDGKWRKRDGMERWGDGDKERFPPSPFPLFPLIFLSSLSFSLFPSQFMAFVASDAKILTHAL